MSKAVVIVLDGFGVGEAPDAADYGDVGSNTLEGIYNNVGQNMQNNPSVQTIQNLINARKNIQNASAGKKSIKIDDGKM